MWDRRLECLSATATRPRDHGHRRDNSASLDTKGAGSARLLRAHVWNCPGAQYHIRPRLMVVPLWRFARLLPRWLQRRLDAPRIREAEIDDLLWEAESPAVLRRPRHKQFALWR